MPSLGWLLPTVECQLQAAEEEALPAQLADGGPARV